MMYAVFFSSRISWIVWSRIVRWSQVALPGIPPAWASVNWTCFFTLSLMIRSYNFPGLLARVIPLSFEHFPLIPFPLYSRRMCPSCQLSGISSFSCILLSADLNISLVFLFASMNVSLGISSGPRLFFLLSFFITLLSSLYVIFSVFFSCWSAACMAFSTVFSMWFVHVSYSGVPGLAWYRSSK